MIIDVTTKESVITERRVDDQLHSTMHPTSVVLLCRKTGVPIWYWPHTRAENTGALAPDRLDD